MASPFANIALTALKGAIPYCVNQLMPSLENDIFNYGQGGPLASISDPINIRYGEGISAEILFSANQISSAGTTYVVMQTDFDDSNWFDVAWCTTTVASGTSLFLLSSAGPASVQSFNQTRVAGTAPSPANGSNSFGLGSRVRFVGKSSATISASASSLSSGLSALQGMLVSISYRLAPLR